jgi:hypothetical protein
MTLSAQVLLRRENRVITVLATALLLGGVYLLAMILFPPSLRTKNAWFMDEQTGQLVVEPATAIPPLLNKDHQPTLVRAIFVTCTTDQDRRLAYLEKYTPEAQAAFADVRSGAQPLTPAFLFTTQTGHMIRRPDAGSRWVRATSAEGVAILNGIKCGESIPRYCPP